MVSQNVKKTACYTAAAAASAALIYAAVKHYGRAVETYEAAVKSLDPVKADLWRRAHAFETSARDVLTRFRNYNTVERTIKHYNDAGEVIRRTVVKVPAERVSFTDFWNHLHPVAKANLERTAKAAGYTLDRALDYVKSCDIPAAGLSPIPVAPSAFLYGLGTTVAVVGTGLLAHVVAEAA